jgi:small subunit ribosomal protein S14
MARAKSFVKLNTPQKFSTRHRNRCKVCGRSRGYYRDFELCRICLRMFALRGEVPGVVKASW